MGKSAERAVAARQPAPLLPGRASALVLLIEDDLSLSGALARYLRAHGHATTVAASAEEATRILRAGARPTVVLLDINLPGESGWSLLRSKILGSAGDPPVYIMSAINITSAHLREFGCAGYLPKPFAVATLLEIVERHQGTPGAGGSSAARTADAQDPGGVDLDELLG